MLRSPTRFAGGDPGGGQPFQACQAGHLAHQGGSYNTVVTQALLCCRVVIGAKLKIVACSALGSSEQCNTVRNLQKKIYCYQTFSCQASNQLKKLPKTIGYYLLLMVEDEYWNLLQGDYFAVVLPEGANRSVVIHQLSKWRSQVPFSKSKGQVQCLLFHPIR